MPLPDHTDEFSQVLADLPSTRVEDYLAQTTTHVNVDVRHLVLAEMTSRRSMGEELAAAEYKSRFPELADIVEQLIEQAGEEAERTLAGEPVRPTASLPARSELGDHELLEVIGRGGMGIVYRARQKKLNRIVALKTIVTGQHADAEEVERFRREAEAAARLDHAGIVPVFEIGDHDGMLYFSMAFVAGSSLADHLRENTLTPQRAASVIKSLAEAVQYAHEAGVVHRDLKPANVLLDEKGQPKIVDFGLARLIDHDGDLTRTGAAVGTPSYMSPEQATGTMPVGPASDVYGLGALLYACLAGIPPFRGPSAMATLKMVAQQPPTPLRQLRSDVPKDLETVCNKCLEKHPASRYPSAAALARELDRFLNGRPIEARPVPVWVRAGRWCQRNPIVASLLSAIAVTLIVGIAVSVYFAMLAEGRATTAEKASETAKQQTDRAQQQSKLAKQQSQLALKSLQMIIHSVQERLKDIPEAREVRRELLLQAIEDLKAVSGSYIEQATVDRESAKALADLAQLYTEIGDEAGQGVVKLSEEHFRQAVDIYLQLLEQDPDDDELARAAFQTMVDYGDTAREYGQFKQAVWAHRQGRDVAVAWHQRAPDVPDAQLAYLMSAEALGEALLRSGKRDEARQYILEAEKLAVSYSETQQDIKGFQNLARCYCTVGDYYRLTGKWDQAEAAYQRMCNTTLKLIELEPDNPQWLNDRSADFERLGDLEMGRKDYEAAREHFEECLRLAEQYVGDDPTNLYRLQESTWAYSKLANVCKIQGDKEREQWAREKLADIRRQLRGK